MSSVFEEARGPLHRRIVLALVLVALLTQAIVLVLERRREPHVDEIEHLHAGWLVANGEQIYRTFFEHHPPLLYALLATQAPKAIGVAAEPYAIRARLLCGVAGLIWLACFGAVVWRFAPSAALVSLLLLLASGPAWLRLVADVRPDVFALCFFWAGTAGLFLTSEKWFPLLAAPAVASVLVSTLWAPKWPLTTALVLVAALVRGYQSERRWRSLAGLLGLLVLAVFLLHSVAPLPETVFFVFEFNRPLHVNAPQALAAYFTGEPFQYAPSAFRPEIIALLCVVVVAAAVFDRQRRSGLLWVALLVATAAELRWIHPYPAVWLHNYAMWIAAGAALYGLLPKGLESLSRALGAGRALRRRVHLLTSAALVLTAGAHAWAVWGGSRTGQERYWRAQRAVVATASPETRVWVSTRMHPITLPDAHYYWLGFEGLGVLDVADSLRRTARGRELLPATAPLPVCAALRTPDTSLLVSANLTSDPRLSQEASCLRALEAGGRTRPSAVPELVLIAPPHGPQLAVRIRPQKGEP